MKRSKAYRAAENLVEEGRLYSPAEAVALARKTSTTKFDPTVEVAFRLGVDPRKADQMVRGTVNLPHGTGKTARVLVFATGDRAEEARAAGADYVGSDDLIERIQGGFLDFDAVVATPDLMGRVGRLGRVLGPRGLMPNPKTGTVTPDVGKAVTDIKGGKIEFRVDRHANLHFIIGKASFPPAALVENYAAALEEIMRLKPSAAKGRYLRKASITTTMGPSIPVDPAKTRGLTEELEPASAAIHPGQLAGSRGPGVGGLPVHWPCQRPSVVSFADRRPAQRAAHAGGLALSRSGSPGIAVAPWCPAPGRFVCWPSPAASQWRGGPWRGQRRWPRSPN